MVRRSSLAAHSKLSVVMHTIARGLTYIDLNFLGRPRVIATAIVRSPGGVALIDPGPSTCLETLRRALGEQGVAVADIQALLLTHIHLDHAGAAGALVKENPQIEVYVHERGAPHMTDPAKLLESATRLYGDDIDRLWGEFLPVPKANIRSLDGGEHLDVAGRRFEVAYIPGHASHHVGYFDRASGVAFVGDTAGVRTGKALFVMPPTPPPDIDVAAWVESVEVMRRWQPSTLFITHFGPHEDVLAHLDAFLEHLTAMKDIARRVLEREGSDDDRMDAFKSEARIYLQRRLPADEVELYDFAAPLSLGWHGLARYWRKRGVGAQRA